MKIISNISAFASIIGFLIPYFSASNNNNSPKIQTSTFQFICLGVFIIASILVLYKELNSLPKKYRNNNEIVKYMLNWISRTGRTLIFTRDMSWAVDIKVKDKLMEKSQNKELILCMPIKTAYAAELEKLGAEVYEFPQLKYTPESRFTIIHYGRSDAKLAIGRTGNDGIHRITEFENGVHLQFHVAEDLVNIIKSAHGLFKNS